MPITQTTGKCIRCNDASARHPRHYIATRYKAQHLHMHRV
ncbi:hypothetical protein PAMC26577_31150 [Caballeronia sordidicola]|uniref:Uncharacterized protein n=1 Tax=Caballeronia sordidicola TaxID=196367 RepID=A0A242MEX4_CABSO|nr:hypothetical protein PAMC26577_31150 [Caballeronia sordidicola]